MKKTNQRISSLLLLLLAAIALLAFGVFTNVLTDLWGHNIKELFQNNPILIALFALLLGLVGYLYTKIESRHEKTAPEAVDKDQYEEAFVQFRKLLLEQYQTRLASKTGRRLPVNLTAKSTHFGTAPARVQAYFKDKELTIESENIASEIDKILNDNARLLLIGDPGAGKTTILLYAAINILRDADEPKLPLILNLATWTKDRDFAEWYAQNIAQSYSLSPVFVRELLRRNAVVPFFDGFDEVAEEHRDDCFQKMAAYFGDEKRKQLIVSSRKKEYAAAKAYAPVYAEIEVLPLSLTQIKRSLSENAESQAADRALLHALEHDRWLAEAVETPFYLNTASFLFGKGQRMHDDFRSKFKADSTEGRQAELVEIFVTEQVPEGRDRKYLSFLAGKMNEENFLVFELVKMQPRWCGKIYWYRLALALPFALVFIFLFAFVSDLTVVGWILSLTLGLITGLELGWILSYSISYGVVIHTRDIQTWDWQKFVKDLKYNLINHYPSLLLAIMFIWFIGIYPDPDMDKRLGSGMRQFMVFYFASFLTLLLIIGLKISGTTTKFLLHISNPYQRFWSTFHRFFWIIPAVVLALASGVWAANDWGRRFSWQEIIIWVQNLGFRLRYFPKVFFLVSLPPFLLAQFPQHFSLRLVLNLEGKMPLRVVTFMDRMTDQHIFEDTRRKDKKGRKRRGATWRFRHKILQDYFAGNPA